ncbi:MAG: hypothetical protein HNEKOMLI_00636 [Sodalis sp. Psp]|nr:hypothetical protein [Sodalis sp. Psp]MCR3757103.1 hypothetical protein [Sodalis sp. Ppy]
MYLHLKQDELLREYLCKLLSLLCKNPSFHQIRVGFIILYTINCPATGAQGTMLTSASFRVSQSPWDI